MQSMLIPIILGIRTPFQTILRPSQESVKDSEECVFGADHATLRECAGIRCLKKVTELVQGAYGCDTKSRLPSEPHFQAILGPFLALNCVNEPETMLPSYLVIKKPYFTPGCLL